MISFPKMALGYLLALFTILSGQVAMAYSYRVELWLNPVVRDFSAINWKLDPKTRYWSARVRGEKVDKNCIYVKGQRVTALVKIAPLAEGFEVPVVYLQDDTPDSTRPAGYQDFGRWQFNAPNLPIGSSLVVSVKNDCPHRKKITTSEIGPFVIQLPAKT